MPSAFLSYASSDGDLARELIGRLGDLGWEVPFDAMDAAAASSGTAREDAIIRADAFVALVSENWRTSDTCQSDLDRAVDFTKRRVLCVPGGDLPDGISQAVLLDSAIVSVGRDEENSMASLDGALAFDQDWLSSHTYLLLRSLEWSRADRHVRSLLRGHDLIAAERWLTSGVGDRSRTIAPVQAEYIAASRQATNRRQRRSPLPRRQPPVRRKVFISYRRENAAAWAGRLYDRLLLLLGNEQVFMDVDSIRPGRDFGAALDGALEQSGVVLAVMDSGWSDVRERDGRRRLDNPSDYVRRELEGAFARGVDVMPVLIDGAAMPRKEDLPGSLRQLCAIQSLSLSHSEWSSDVAKLLQALPPAISQRRPGSGWARKVMRRTNP